MYDEQTLDAFIALAAQKHIAVLVSSRVDQAMHRCLGPNSKRMKMMEMKTKIRLKRAQAQARIFQHM